MAIVSSMTQSLQRVSVCRDKMEKVNRRGA
jgi:hypothetical protein